MRLYTRKLYFIAAAVGILCIGGLLSIFNGCAEAEPIKIGFSGQLTGIYSDLGVQGRNGVQLAIENMNKAGGINGRTLELIVENDENSIEGALQADKKLIEEGVVAIIGHMTSSQTLGVEKFIRDQKIPLISPTASSPLLEGKQDYIFRLNPSSDRSAAVMGKYANNYLEKKRVAVLYDMNNKAYSLPYAQEFVHSFMELGGRIPLQIEFSSEEEVGWAEIINRIDEEDVAAVAIVASAADTAAFAQEIREQDKEWKIFGSGWAYTQNLIQYGGRAVEGLMFTDSFNSESTHPAYKEFKAQYIKRFGREPMFAAAQGYESVLFLQKGLERKSEYGGNLIKALQNIEEIEGLLGTLYFNLQGDVRRPFFISKVTEGEFKVIGSI